MAVLLSNDDARGMVALLRDAVAAHVAHGGNNDATLAALVALRTACSSYSTWLAGHNCGAIGGTPGAIEGLLAVFSSHLGVAGVHTAAMQALYWLAVNSAVNQERIGDTPGALQSIVASMKARARDADLQYYGIEALHTLASANTGNQHRMRTSPQLLRLVAAAADHDHDAWRWEDAGHHKDRGEEVLTALDLSPAQARAAAAKVRCTHPHPCHSTPYDRSTT